MKKLLDSDWLRAVQCNTSEIQMYAQANSGP